MPVASHHQDPVEQQKSTIEKTDNLQIYRVIKWQATTMWQNMELFSISSGTPSSQIHVDLIDSFPQDAHPGYKRGEQYTSVMKANYLC